MISNIPITVFIADDHPVFRKGLRDVIMESPHVSILGETGEGDRVVEVVRQLLPDVLLLDLNMPGTSGLDVAALLLEEHSQIKIIVLTMHKEEALFNRALDMGVRGYVLKDSAVCEILESIRAVVQDEYYISPAISQYLVKRRAKGEALLHENPGLNDLSASERKILKLISQNKTSKEIADLLFISVRTVENHRMNICKKLNLHGSNGLLKFAIENRSYL